MKKIIYSVLFTLITCHCFGQETITGTILDKKSNVPLVYAHIINKNNRKATITNEDGKFELKCSKQDTIIISYLSYERKEIPSSYFLTKDIYYLTPIINDLQTVEIFTKNYILDLLFAAKEKMAKSKEQNGKVYFTLKSNSNDSPTELIEAYYNGKIKPSGFGDLEMKNGRLGVAKDDSNNYFVSLSTTHLISKYNILKKSRIFPVIKKDPKKVTTKDRERIPALPINPLQLPKIQIKKKYNYKIIAKKGNIYEIEFKAKNDDITNDFFDAIIGIDIKLKQIVFIELSGKNIKHPPFYEINQLKIENLNFNLNYYFDNSTNNFLTKVLFDYSFSYKDFKKQIKSKGVFLFYDKENLFQLPLYSTTRKLLSDYRKIVYRPFDDLFWKNIKEVIITSKESQAYKDFFYKHGVLLNFNDFNFSNHPLLKENSFEWSKKRKISYYSMSNDPDSNFKNYDNIKTTSFNFNLSYQLFLDRNTFNDSTYYKTQTIINPNECFYYLKKNRFTSCFINIYFDLVEVARRHMVNVLNKREWTKSESDSIFKSTLSNLDTDLKEYLKRVNLGNNSKELKTYINKINTILGVDNTHLIRNTDPIKVYDSNAKLDYGVRLLKSKKYKEALDYFKEHEDLGEKYPWIYYNIGLAYLYLKEKNTACLYFKKSIELGQQIDPEISRQCDLLEEAKN